MADEERRRKPFEQCSRRHQRRIIQEDITKLYLQKLQYMHSYDNSVKVDSCNIFHNDALNICNEVYIDEATSGCIANNELEDINFEEDSARSPSVCLELMENDRESNKQLLEVSNNNVQNAYEEHFNELISENIEYCHYNSDDDLDVNELFHKNVQSSDEEN